jgi:hypothetical protein
VIVVVPLLLLFLNQVFGVVLHTIVLDDVCMQDVLLVAWGMLGFYLTVLCPFVTFLRLLLGAFLMGTHRLHF